MLTTVNERSNRLMSLAISVVASVLLGAFYIQSASAEQLEVQTQIEYQLDLVWKKKVKDGRVLEEKVEQQKFLGEVYQYRIEYLNTKEPVLKKFLGKELVEQKKLSVLNITTQGNIYLVDLSSIGNIVLISVFPKQKTVAVSMQYWWSSEDVVILWQGFGKYRD